MDHLIWLHYSVQFQVGHQFQHQEQAVQRQERAGALMVLVCGSDKTSRWTSRTARSGSLDEGLLDGLTIGSTNAKRCLIMLLPFINDVPLCYLKTYPMLKKKDKSNA